ncbi:MAG: hypothetical protein AVDCRST_MAG06-3384, partial [uncultured Nocardioides sp.]
APHHDGSAGPVPGRHRPGRLFRRRGHRQRAVHRRQRDARCVDQPVDQPVDRPVDRREQPGRGIP